MLLFLNVVCSPSPSYRKPPPPRAMNDLSDGSQTKCVNKVDRRQKFFVQMKRLVGAVNPGFTYGREVLTVVFIFYCQCGWIIVFPTHILSRPPQSFRLFATVWPEAARLLSPWDSLGRNTGMGCHALLQQIFPNQGLNSCLLHYMQILYH